MVSVVDSFDLLIVCDRVVRSRRAGLPVVEVDVVTGDDVDDGTESAVMCGVIGDRGRAHRRRGLGHT